MGQKIIGLQLLDSFDFWFLTNSVLWSETTINHQKWFYNLHHVFITATMMTKVI